MIDREELKEALKEMFRDGTIRIYADIAPEHAKAGSGQWNNLNLQVDIGDETVYERAGNVDLIEGR